jgi:hypothetical protein
MTEQEINQIADKVAEKVLHGLRNDGARNHGLQPKMTTLEVAKLKGCSPHTVRRNWQHWGLRKLGNGAHGVANYEGESVQEHLNRINGAES